MLYDYLVSHYKKGEPIFIEDIHIEGMNRPNFCQQLKTLTDNGKLKDMKKVFITFQKRLCLKPLPVLVLKQLPNINISLEME